MATGEALSAFYFERLKLNELHIQRCKDTGTFQWYPRNHSLASGGAVEWVKASGTGTVFSFCRMHRGPAPASERYDEPVLLGLVELDEGPLVLARLEVGDGAAPVVGDDVRLSAHVETAEGIYPVFRSSER